MKQTLTKAVKVVLVISYTLIFLSGCALLPTDEEEMTKQAAVETQQICSVATSVVLKTPLMVNSVVEKAIVDSGCFAVGSKKTSTLTYIVEKDAITATKNNFKPGKVDGVISTASYLFNSAVTGATDGYRITLKLNGVQSVGEVTSVTFSKNPSEAIREASMEAIKNLILLTAQSK